MTNIEQTIGNRVMQARLAAGVSRKKLAEKLGITHQQLQKYEKGMNRVSVSRLIDIAAHTQSPLDFFFGGISDTPYIKHLAERQKYHVKVMKDFVSLPKEEQKVVSNLIKQMAA